jgi:ferrochelatase
MRTRELSKERYGVLMMQLGTPASPTPEDVREFLRVFLGDPRVVDVNPFFWKILLHGIILPTRPKIVSKAYEKIWDGEQFPLTKYSDAYVEAVREELKALDLDQIDVRWASIIGEPDLDRTLQDMLDKGCTRLRVIPQFPQYSEATVESAWDKWEDTLTRVSIPDHVTVEKIPCFHYYDNPGYIDALVDLCEETIERDRPEKLLLSFHGYPLRRIDAGDPYMAHCVGTAQAMAERLKGLNPEDVIICFQSKFGREQWLEPSTEDTLMTLAEQGVKRVAVCCPAFTVDCLETEEEIGIGLKEEFLEAGGEHFSTIEALNARPSWVRGSVRGLILPDLEEIPKVKVEKPKLEVPKQVWKVEPLSKEAKVSLKSIFFILFLDLVGFSIIFPLFPQMLTYYGSVEAETGLFASMMDFIRVLETHLGGATGYYQVLFGGLLGSLYSILQFICSPFIGALSDRIGRRPILIISLVGIAISYGLWFFAGSFAVLVAARLLGGVMSGNIATATAVVADVTQPSNRSKGMALIGIAFGLGFIIGPAFGAFFSLIDVTKLVPSLVAYGVNPFSGAALLAFILTVINLIMVLKSFKETLPPEKRQRSLKVKKSINPLKLFAVVEFPGVSLNNMTYFFFLLAFSGMEFTLTFLTFERFQYGNVDQGMMFVFIGFVLVMMQGGYVRRKAPEVGERKMANRGMLALIPGLSLLAFAQSGFLLYAGLFLMAVGSAQVIPCLTTLASRYAPENEQGRVVGVFRSLGALARAIGPLLACFLYWKIGSKSFYLIGAAFVFIPFYLSTRLPAPPKKATAGV